MSTFVIPVDIVYYRTDKCFDSFRVVYRTNDIQSVTHAQYSFSVWNKHVAVLQNTRANKVTTQELLYITKLLTAQSFILNLNGNVIRFKMRISFFVLTNIFLFLL